MSSMENDSLAVRRQLLPEQHVALLSGAPSVREACGELCMSWFGPGTVACTLIERGEYKGVLRRPGGTLWQRGADSVAHSICSKLTEMPTANSTLEARVSNIDYLGRGRYLRIAYMLDSPDLMAENQELRNYLDAENQSKNNWQPFTPMIYVARIKTQDATEDVLDAVWQIGQPLLTLLPPAPVLIDPS